MLLYHLILGGRFEFFGNFEMGAEILRLDGLLHYLGVKAQVDRTFGIGLLARFVFFGHGSRFLFLEVLLLCQVK
jgi:hypothetical protein